MILKYVLEKIDTNNDRSGQLGDASKTLSVEELPPIMILHLKRMVHDGYTEQKVMKKIDFPVDLFIDKVLLIGAEVLINTQYEIDY